ncbi:MAG: glycine cleavage system aminomethyltransferase GcvT [Ignavibacteria bacterium]|nr:glycine cleavage system aminomethyltransferase GcvT [Ignavibacteria bacterium]MBI3765067.1 glycine cleavage system aminomethyltransferase GcvT [Ignavibacteriales bacterium]
MKRTAFYSIHQHLGAKIVEFGGFEMPVLYTGIVDEHKTVRATVGMFDVSHMGEFEVRGRDAQALVQKITTNDVTKLGRGKAQYSSMCYPDGGIIDDLLVYDVGDRYMLVVNASNIAKDFEWVTSNIGSLDVELTDKSDTISLLAVQGPKSLETLQKVTASVLSSIPYYSFIETSVAGIPMIVSRTGYTGELGFELYFDSSLSTAEKVWNAVMESGKEFHIKPVGLGARDTLRLEMGFCLYGNDIDRTTNPLEAGLGWITKLDKGEFIGRESLVNVRQAGVKRKLVGFVIDEPKAFPRHGYEIRSNGHLLGHVTSGTVSPILEKGIGMGYVASEVAQVQSPINIIIRTKEVKAQIVKLPFIKK